MYISLSGFTGVGKDTIGALVYKKLMLKDIDTKFPQRSPRENESKKDLEKRMAFLESTNFRFWFIKPEVMYDYIEYGLGSLFCDHVAHPDKVFIANRSLADAWAFNTMIIKVTNTKTSKGMYRSFDRDYMNKHVFERIGSQYQLLKDSYQRGIHFVLERPYDDWKKTMMKKRITDKFSSNWMAWEDLKLEPNIVETFNGLCMKWHGNSQKAYRLQNIDPEETADQIVDIILKKLEKNGKA